MSCQNICLQKPKWGRTLLASLAGSEGAGTFHRAGDSVATHPWWVALHILSGTEPQTRGKERWLRDRGEKLGKETGLCQWSLLFWVSTHSNYLGFDKALVGTSQLLGSLLIRSLWAESASGQATDTVLLWRKNSNHRFPAFLIISEQGCFPRKSGPD